MSSLTGTPNNITTEKNTSWKKALIVLMIASFCSYFGTNMSTSNFVVFLNESGFSSTMVSTLVSMFPFAVMIMSFFSGRLCQKINPVILLMASVAITLITYICYAILPTNVYIYIILRIFQGLANGLNMVTFMAIIARTIPDTMMARGMGMMSIGSIVAQAFAPSIGISISEAYGFPAMFLISLIPLGLSFAVAFFIIGATASGGRTKATGSHEKKKFSFFNYFEKSIIKLALVNFLYTCGWATVTWYLVAFAKEQGIEGVSVYFIVSSATLLLVRLASGKFLDKINIKYVLYFSCAMTCINMVLIYFANALWVLLIAAVFSSLSTGLASPALQAEAVRGIPMERRSVASSTFTLSSSIAFIVGSFVSGIISGAVGYADTFLIMTIPVILAAVVNTFTKYKQAAKAA